ncbi:hypothetical protein [Streptomyces sp. NPDC001292]|uniref:hypothetical protein n=1 Tax=Streptomyces sp. NPDC001292 TaxID=3364558 RepID=UPI0036811BEE
MNMRHFWRHPVKVNQGGVMAGIGKRMEPDRTSARLSGGAVTAAPYDDAAVTEVRMQV